ncbi:MAG: glycosyltransferase family 9 protein [Chitinispirillales bacterium]|jgi:ADP-heptose:LPS heptosyltransferase|nr:glycosyltransferase family 9 protein [Chitinispirillales bacterium]
MKILIFAPYGIGNVILLLPVLRALKEKNIEFDILSFHGAAGNILDNWEEFSNLYKNHFHLGKNRAQVLKTVLEVRKRKYDVSVLSFPSAKFHYNLLSFICGAKRRTGSVYPDNSFKTLAFLNNAPYRVIENIHDAEQNLNLMKEAGILEPGCGVEKFSGKISSGKIIGFHVGCSKNASYKRWDVKNWDKVVRFLKESYPGYELQFFFGGDELDEQRFFETRGGIKIMKNLTLNQLKNSVSQCRLFLSNDSGLMHIAALCGVETVSVFGPSDQRRNAPFGGRAAVLSANCEKRPCSHSYTIKSHKFSCQFPSKTCLDGVKPEDFIKKIDEILKC